MIRSELGILRLSWFQKEKLARGPGAPSPLTLGSVLAHGHREPGAHRCYLYALVPLSIATENISWPHPESGPVALGPGDSRAPSN